MATWRASACRAGRSAMMPISAFDRAGQRWRDVLFWPPNASRAVPRTYPPAGLRVQGGYPVPGAHAGRGAVADQPRATTSRKAVRTLEVHHLANMKGALHFALLSDWPDSDARAEHRRPRNPRTRAQEEIALSRTSAILGGTAELPHRCIAAGSSTSSECCWMGWERNARQAARAEHCCCAATPTPPSLPIEQPLPNDIVLRA